MKKTIKALSAGGAVFLSLANPVNLLFVVLLFMAGFALFTEQILLVGFISTLALLTAALGAALLAMIFVGFSKTLSPDAFNIFLGLSFVITLAIWSFEIFNTIPHDQWLYVATLAVILFLCSLVLVPKLRTVFKEKEILASG